MFKHLQAVLAQAKHAEDQAAQRPTQISALEAEKASWAERHRRFRARMMMQIEEYALLREEAASAAPSSD